jgi:LPXTG-motif cell wall-anchored protein
MTTSRALPTGLALLAALAAVGTAFAAGEGRGGLPSTGLELSAMAIIGLGLLFLGAALRPRRDVRAHRR